MLKATRIGILFTIMLALAGCNVAGNRDAKGYFYVTSESQGYVVAMDLDTNSRPFIETQIVSKLLPLPEAHKLCDQLNHDLGDSARH